MVKNLPAMWETWVRSLGWEDPWRRVWQPTLVFLPGESPWTEEAGGLEPVGLQTGLSDSAQHSVIWIFCFILVAFDKLCLSRSLCISHRLLNNIIEERISLMAQRVKNLPVTQETQVQSPGWEDPLEKGMATHSSILPGKSHGQRSLATVHEVAKSWTWLSN